MRSVARLRGVERLSVGDLEAACAAADKIGTHVDNLLAIIGFETGGTFSPSQKNRAGSGAVGLIQFMPATASNLGTATWKLAEMSFAEQLVYVCKYFASFRKTLDTIEKLYCAVFWPVAIDKENEYVIGRFPSKVYSQNAGFDKAGRGYFTRADICRAVVQYRATGDGKPRIEIPETSDLTEQEKDQIKALVALSLRNETRQLLDQAEAPPLAPED